MTPLSPDTRTERLREAVITNVYQAVEDGREYGMPPDAQIDAILEEVAAEVAASNRELLERLKAKQSTYMDGGSWEAVPLEAIEAELTRLEAGTEGAK